MGDGWHILFNSMFLEADAGPGLLCAQEDGDLCSGTASEQITPALRGSFERNKGDTWRYRTNKKYTISIKFQFIHYF